MDEKDFRVGEYIIYRNGESYQIGRIKSMRDDGCFVFYHGGETAAKTRFENMHKLDNAHHILKTELGGLFNE